MKEEGSTARLLIALLGTLLSAMALILMIFGYLAFALLLGSGSVGLVVSLIFWSSNGTIRSRPVFQRRLSRSELRILDMTFVMVVALLFLTSLSEPFQRNLGFYLILGFGSFLLLIRILGTDIKQTSSNFLLIFSLVAANLASVWISFPNGIPNEDAYYHYYFMTLPIKQLGGIPFDALYSSTPGAHILAAGLSHIASIDTMSAFTLLATAAMIISGFLVFLWIRRLWGSKVGLLAFLIVANVEYFILLATSGNILSFSFALVMIVLYCLARRADNPRAVWGALITICMVALVFTHLYTAVVFLAILSAIFLIRRAPFVSRDSAFPSSRATMILMFSILLAHWIFFSFSGGLRTIIEATVAYVFLLTGAFPFELTAPTAYAVAPLPYVLVNIAGSITLFGLAMFGLREVLERGRGRSVTFGAFLGLSALLGLGIMVDLPYLLPHRLFIFLEFTALVPLAALGAWKMIGQGTSALAVSVVLLVSFFILSPASSIAGTATSPFQTEVPYTKTFEMPAEAATADWLAYMTPDKSYITRTFIAREHGLVFFRETLIPPSRPGWAKQVPVDLDSGTIPFSELERSSLIVLSVYDDISGFRVGGASSRLGDATYVRLDAFHEAEAASLSKVYDNGPIAIFSKG